MYIRKCDSQLWVYILLNAYQLTSANAICPTSKQCKFMNKVKYTCRNMDLSLYEEMRRIVLVSANAWNCVSVQVDIKTFINRLIPVSSTFCILNKHLPWRLKTKESLLFNSHPMNCLHNLAVFIKVIKTIWKSSTRHCIRKRGADNDEELKRVLQLQVT